MTKNEVFINKALAVHKDTYDYSKIDYTTNNTPITIVCKIHGEFKQRPTDHLAGSGCRICGRKRSEDAKRKTNDQFLEEVKKIHGDKYDYSKVEYKSVKEDIIIICKVHGEFKQKPTDHLNGHGCIQCHRESRKYNNDIFIAKAKEKHKDKYGYSKVKYVNSTTHVIITCPVHGDFSQTPVNHLQYGCQACGGIKKLTLEDLLVKAIEVHGDVYTYDKIESLDGNKSPITITCPKHGDFIKSYNTHISKAEGCPKCTLERIINTPIFTKEEFIEKAKAVHGDVYDYIKVNYIGNNEKVTIGCPIHGDFNQSPNVHFSGSGCPICAIVKRSEISKTPKYIFLERVKKSGNDINNSYELLPELIKMSDSYPIYCKRCGNFYNQILSKHLLSQGHHNCPNKYMTTEEFIDRANKVHDNKYSYVLTNYYGTKYNILATCPVHGDFSQNARGHLSGYGCFKCGRESAIKNTRQTLDEYVKKAKKIHGDKYDYSLVKFNNVNDMIEIKCPLHGIIKQRASGHLKYGCAHCHYDEKKLSQEEFIVKAKEKHGDRFDYSKTIYTGYYNRINIICKKHGLHTQVAGDHLRGVGCKECTATTGETIIINYLNSLGIEYDREFKFENSTRRYDFRFINNKVLLEYDGEMHFMPFSHLGGLTYLDKIRVADKEKDELAMEKGYELIRTNYKQVMSLQYHIKTKLSEIFKYFNNGVFYKTLEDLQLSLGSSANEIKDYNKYKTLNIDM